MYNIKFIIPQDLNKDTNIRIVNKNNSKPSHAMGCVFTTLSREDIDGEYQNKEWKWTQLNKI